jgi:hypothetical protein
MTRTDSRLPAADWAMLLTALCVDSPAWIGTVGEPRHLTAVTPTRFPWLRGLLWRPAGDSFGVALLDLAEPGTMPASAWEPLVGPLEPGRATREGPTLVGRHEPAGTGRRATLTLVTDGHAAGTRAHVVSVRIRVEPA